MSRQQVKISVANKGPLLVKSMFSNYDVCLNSSSGCEFGCSYCYVRFMVKDDEKQWGDFVRIRTHMAERLPRELDKGFLRLSVGRELDLDGDGITQIGSTGKLKKRTIYRNLPISEARLVLGTMTDPYQPIERKYRLTRTALEIIRDHSNQFKKVGIFTRSPIVVDDLDLIKVLPNARIHFTVTPFPPDVMRIIEPISPTTKRRWEVLREIKAAGVRLHVNVSPVMPIISDGFVDEWAGMLAEIGPAEAFIDPMQAYSDSFKSFEEAMKDRTEWSEIRKIMTTRGLYEQWKAEYKARWATAWAKIEASAPNTLLIWSDHITKAWVDLRTGKQMDRRHYNGE